MLKNDITLEKIERALKNNLKFYPTYELLEKSLKQTLCVKSIKILKDEVKTHGSKERLVRTLKVRKSNKDYKIRAFGSKDIGWSISSNVNRI